jgi:predicted O-linked N-acetylglucosamine transferase (SPINDLY family)
MNDVTGAFQHALAALNARNVVRAEEQLRQVLARDPSHSAALNLLVVILMSRGRFAEAEPLIARAVALNGTSDVSFYNYGLIAKKLGKPRLAVEQFSKALAINPNVADTWNNRGTAWSDLKDYERALVDFDRAIALKPSFGGAYANKGKSLLKLRRYEEATAAFERALALQPDLPGVEAARVETKLLTCSWNNIERDISNLIGGVREGRTTAPPFTLLHVSESPEDQLICARAWAAVEHPPASAPLWHGQIRSHDRLRICYVSADFHEHATAYLMAEMLEVHDRSQFDISALSLGADDSSAMRRRLVRSFDHFVDGRDLEDAECARRMFESEIDILVDLKGFTEDARTGIFACRPAPIQVNFLGYPGTMGAPYIDYVVGDGTLFGPADSPFYAEKLVRLPDCYQPNDRRRPIAPVAPLRRDCGLPEKGFVFCCFNNSYKIQPATFDSWMTVLKKVDAGVLWLLETHPSVSNNLRKEAAARGVDPNRLVFAGRSELSAHLARHRLADLFLDTLPCTAHTTASDALWAGLPVLTRLGTTFAGRVAASLLNAVGLPELITRSRNEYETLAVELACSRERLFEIRAKLERNRLRAPLFDAVRFTRHLEAAYESMAKRFQAGLRPDHIDVAPL